MQDFDTGDQDLHPKSIHMFKINILLPISIKKEGIFVIIPYSTVVASLYTAANTAAVDVFTAETLGCPRGTQQTSGGPHLGNR